ncbi:MAG: metal-dependent hydrolase [Pseudomonadota bacterium]
MIAHAAAGAAVYFSQNRLRAQHGQWALPLCVLLAIAPDLDYLAIWLFGVKQEVRVTHTFLFCLCLGAFSCIATRRLRQGCAVSRPFPSACMIAAPLTHLLLDFLVGAHALPLLWPLPVGEVIAPVALLPTVIHTYRFTHPAMWRHFLLECAIVFPVLLASVAGMRSQGRTGWPMRPSAAK